MSVMAWVLAAAVLAAVGWIAVIVGAQILRADRRAQLADNAIALAVAAQQLEATRPGGAPERAIEVVSASQIEPRAERDPCPVCAGRFHVETHEVQRVDGAADNEPQTMRHVVCRCGTCGTQRATWFKLRPAPVAS